MPCSNQCDNLLTQYPGLRRHADEAFHKLLCQARICDVPAHTYMFHEEDPCKNFMWLLEGTVRVFKHSAEGRELTLYRVSPGELCLLSLNSLLGGQSYPASARNDTRVRGLVITAAQFHDTYDVSKGFRTYVLQSLAERLSDMITLVSNVVFRRLDLRLACLLGQRFERSGGKALRITPAELAHELGTTREVVSRILKEFERQECIALTRGEIHLISQDGLQWFQQAKEA